MPPLVRFLLLVPAAYVAASIFAGFVVAVGRPDLSAETVLYRIFFTATVAGLFMLGPMLVAVFVAEALDTHSPLYWLAIGGMAGLVAEIGDAIGSAPVFTGPRLAVPILAGLGAGAVYWAIAGRWTGVARSESRDAGGEGTVRSIWRIVLLIPAAYVAASFAAALLIVLSAGAQPYAGEPTVDFVAKVILVSLITSMFVGAVAAVPALIMIVLGEVFAWRSLILHLAIGAAIGYVALLTGIGGPTEQQADLALGGGAGAVAGFVYWLIAGRKAGTVEHAADTSVSQ